MSSCRLFLAPFGLFCAAAVSVLADDAAQESRFIANPRQLIFEGKRSGEGYFHPDGNLLIFQSERDEGNPFYQIYLLDLLSGESARVSPGTGKTTCAFFQPGTSRVLFASTHHDPETAAKQKVELDFRASGKQRRYAWDYDATMDLFSANQDGTQIQRLTEAPGYDAESSTKGQTNRRYRQIGASPRTGESRAEGVSDHVALVPKLGLGTLVRREAMLRMQGVSAGSLGGGPRHSLHRALPPCEVKLRSAISFPSQAWERAQIVPDK